MYGHENELQSIYEWDFPFLCYLRGWGKRWSHDSCPLCKSIKGIVFSAVGCWMVCSNVSDDFQSTEMFSWRLRFLHSTACCSIFLRPPCGKTFYYRERKSRTEKMLSVSALFLCGCENGLREAARLAGSSRASPEKPAAGWCCEDILRAETGEKGGTISKLCIEWEINLCHNKANDS